MRLFYTSLLSAAMLAGCAGAPEQDPVWKDIRTVAYRVESRVDDTVTEQKWLGRMFQLESEKIGLFRQIEELRDGAAPSDLHVFIIITRLKRWGKLKAFIDVEFIDGKTNKHLGRRSFITKSTDKAEDPRSRQKAAGQIAVDIARKILFHIRIQRF